MCARRSGLWVAGCFCMAAGCAGPLPITPDVAGTVADKTVDLFQAGKAEMHQAVSLEESIAAAREAGGRLELSLVREEPHPDQLKIVYRDMRKLDIVITLVRRSPEATQIRVDVGLFGDAGMGRLVLAQIARALPERNSISLREDR